MKPLMLMALSVLALGSSASAQADAAHQPVPMKGEGPQAVQMPPTPQMPAFETLAKKGPDGKIVALETVSDIAAFERNKLIPAAALDSIKPAILNWLADVDQLAIDNIDFMEQLDPEDGKKGMIDKVNVEDKVLLTQMAQMMTQLMSAGPLTAHLESKGVLTREQAALNQQITSDYLQQRMNEIQAQETPPEAAGNPEAAKNWKVNNLTKFLYALSCNDSVVSYRRMLSDSAAHIDAIVGGLGLSGEAAAKVAKEIPAVKAAKSKVDQRKAVRKVMNHLTFEQRRQFLTKARELAPVKDPIPANVS
jgi:hypothetical protein